MASKAMRSCAVAGVLLVALLIAIAPCPARAKTQLSINEIYGSEEVAKSCLNIIWAVASRRLTGALIPNCLRMAYHDAGTYNATADDGGANGSTLNPVELDNAIDGGLAICGSFMPSLVAEVRAYAGCNKATAADVIQVAGAVAVYLAGGPACGLLMGRPDYAGADDVTRLPSFCGSASNLVGVFEMNGFTDPQASLVVLSGAHTLGHDRAVQRGPCSVGVGPMTSKPTTFDNHYYTNLIGPTTGGPAHPSPGWFRSDNQLYRGDNKNLTAAVAKYAASNRAFLQDWCPHYQEMSLLGVNPAPFTLSSGWMPANLPARPGQ